ncbi:UxaA family hydrolase [Chryseobacterium indoltheticum]|uniref:Altronate hydrolase n=1 Tax=Chryseobacterium indoltheticum TaxID=254 RepID=A0A381F8E7_9FLAO|nr:altronate dehydratase family protein [Chryseobacterium indoltheticum]AZA75857.1 altronate dehydratase [Chryseobacterium indoltheticum]SIP94201.1 altronate hydrolase [Chryseobacterium indoltheticum]SUX42738.1 D-galactarate dehydratase [Chryseobacterium indoltheticum]
MQKKVLKVNPKDNVIVALMDLPAGESVHLDGTDYTILKDIKAKHKFAAVDFEDGDHILMYGVIVGKANQSIKQGEVITTENVKHQSAKVVGKTETLGWTPPNVDKWKDRTFNGYHREDGQVGTENVWLFFPLVFCENKNIETLKDIFEKELLHDKASKHQLLLRSLLNGGTTDIVEEEKEEDTRIFKNIDVRFITHQGGCGGIRQDAEALGRLFAGYVNNPNVAGATVLSLGCQNLQVQIFMDSLHALAPNNKKPIVVYEQQKSGTIDEMLTGVIKDSYEGIKKANEIERKPASITKLNIGLECGGSDGFSGISANPVLGEVSDIMAAVGGTTMLAEFPELCGVEQELVNRCINDEDGVKFLKLMKDFEASVVAAGSGFDMNPSPGNIKDGLITDAMKSAGASKKGGAAPIVEVLDFTEYATKPGLNLLCTPGNDAECTTALVGSGATVVLFTTGLGTPMGNPITPVVKISSNTVLAEKMSDIIDFNAGTVISGEKTIPEAADELLELIINVASGEVKTKADVLNQNDFIPWRRGVSL